MRNRLNQFFLLLTSHILPTWLENLNNVASFFQFFINNNSPQRKRLHELQFKIKKRPMDEQAFNVDVHIMSYKHVCDFDA